MKTLAIVIGVMALPLIGEAGPSSPSGNFNQAVLRQDFTGQGTYHRIGMIREQERAVAARPTPDPATPRVQSGSWLVRLWNTIFPPRKSTTRSKP